MRADELRHSDFRSKNEHQLGASLVLIRSQGQVFGGFAADPWDLYVDICGTRAGPSLSLSLLAAPTRSLETPNAFCFQSQRT